MRLRLGDSVLDAVICLAWLEEDASKDTLPLQSLADNLASYGKNYSPSNVYFVADKAYNDGVLTALCKALQKPTFYMFGCRVPGVPLPELHEDLRLFAERLEQAASGTKDPDLSNFLIEFHRGLILEEENSILQLVA